MDDSRRDAESPAFSKPIVVPDLTMKSKSGAAGVQNRVPLRGDLSIPGGESPRYPEDFAIGLLGPGGIEPRAYAAARGILEGMRSGEDLAELVPAIDQGERGRIREKLRSVRPSVHRIGGGRVGQGGGVSFLIRFIGPELSLSGELFMAYKDGAWIGDDIRMDEPLTNRTPEGIYRFDPMRYTRFL